MIFTWNTRSPSSPLLCTGYNSLGKRPKNDATPVYTPELALTQCGAVHVVPQNVCTWPWDPHKSMGPRRAKNTGQSFFGKGCLGCQCQPGPADRQHVFSNLPSVPLQRRSSPLQSGHSALTSPALQRGSNQPTSPLEMLDDSDPPTTSQQRDAASAPLGSRSMHGEPAQA